MVSVKHVLSSAPKFVRRWTVAIAVVTLAWKQLASLWDEGQEMPKRAVLEYSSVLLSSSSNATHLLKNNNISSDMGQNMDPYQWRRVLPNLLASADVVWLDNDSSNLLEIVAANHSIQKTPKNTTAVGAFVHIGKTGGSTLSTLLRNGCHSFVKKPCRNISRRSESYMSRLTTYYHVPDFDRLAKARHLFYAFTTRDPLDRTISAFAYLHPLNVHARNATVHRRYARFYNPCFRTLEDFALALGNETSKEWCNLLAKRALNHGFRRHDHLFFDHQKIFQNVQQQPSFLATAAVMVIRNEFLWQDWASANMWLGQENVSIYPSVRERDVSAMALPVPKEISTRAREYLCEALHGEYDVYFRLLRSSVNLVPDDLLNSLEIAKTNCPNLNLTNTMLTAP